jgi:predicted HTH transcriptional regulator
VGVDDNGLTPGIEKGSKLDTARLAISNNINGSKLTPKPTFTFHAFDVPSNPDKCILIVHVHKADTRPCMLDGRIYVRSGPSTQFATPVDVRRMILE